VVEMMEEDQETNRNRFLKDVLVSSCNTNQTTPPSLPSSPSPQLSSLLHCHYIQVLFLHFDWIGAVVFSNDLFGLLCFFVFLLFFALPS
jgi:hypothetical protein